MPSNRRDIMDDKNTIAKIIERVPLALIILGVIVFITGAAGGLPIGNPPLQIVDAGWRLGLGVFGFVLTALGIVLLLYEDDSFKKKNRIKKMKPREKVDLFITSPMSAYKDSPDSYEKNYKEMMDAISKLRGNRNVNMVYFFNEPFPNLKAFTQADMNLPEYLEQIELCDYFVMIISDALMTSAHFEAGYAFALQKQAIYFVKNKTQIPFIMRLAAYANPEVVRIYEYETVGEIEKVLTNYETYRSR